MKKMFFGLTILFSSVTFAGLQKSNCDVFFGIYSNTDFKKVIAITKSDNSNAIAILHRNILFSIVPNGAINGMINGQKNTAVSLSCKKNKLTIETPKGAELKSLTIFELAGNQLSVFGEEEGIATTITRTMGSGGMLTNRNGKPTGDELDGYDSGVQTKSEQYFRNFDDTYIKQ